MKKILLLYFSGSGSTKMIAEILELQLKANGYKTDIQEITNELSPEVLIECDFLILGVPTYNGLPPKTVLSFIEKIPNNRNLKNIFLFATYGLYPVNNLRILAQKLLHKNIKTVGSIGFRGPASDGVLLFPSWIKFMFNYEKNIKLKINQAVSDISSLVDNKKTKQKIPAYKWYAPLDWLPNTVFTAWYFRKFLKPNIKVIPERLGNNKVDSISSNFWEIENGIPIYKNCEDDDFSLRSVHRTPNKAVIFSERMKDKPRLDKEFYSKHKKQILDFSMKASKHHKETNELPEIIAGVIFFTLFTILFNVFYDQITLLSDDFDAIRPFYNVVLVIGIILTVGRMITRSNTYRLFVELIETSFFVILGVVFWVVFPFNTATIGDENLWNIIFRLLIVVPPALALLGFLFKIIKVYALQSTKK